MSNYDFNQLIRDVEPSSSIEVIVHEGRALFSVDDCLNNLSIFTNEEAAQWLRRLSDREKIDVPFTEDGEIFSGLTEAGAYRLMVQSDHPGSGPFREWLLREVMPAINLYPEPDTVSWLVDMLAEHLEIRPGAPFDERDKKFDIAFSLSTFYRVVLRSTETTAQPIQDWVFGEIVPAIRREGRYQIPAWQKGLLQSAFSRALRDHSDELKKFVDCLTPSEIADAPVSIRVVSLDDIMD
ncbi:hypothetical protein [Blastochloris sulfoviridis]|uniref:Bro-N domain-containing protein n=1 Tax=Blastochloris sulfoviridis TaxID=50712 RepID=A0A5M6I3P7_9HYPH|nr:hypothetical protein [Blastochloris sulfoviridis]KAA5602831.1 hypothetical protein F1193_03020 [Blastochloris sulfoviridis]